MRKYGCLTIAGQHEFSSISLKLEHLLANVEQAPSRSMQDALLPPMKALISSAILRHLDEDVRVAVASCMSEIARITAPDAPYNDDLMKEIFQLTVASFEKLSHESGHCYTKAVSILENVARSFGAAKIKVYQDFNNCFVTYIGISLSEDYVRRFNKHRSSVPTSNKKRSLDVTSDEDVREAFKDKKIKSSDMDGSYQEETPQPKLKRRRTPRKEVFSGTPGLGEHLVGSKIKVWWPIDKRFYEGVVDSYDPIKKKHKVLYADGDEEKLNLKRQRWEFIEDGIFPVQGQEIDVPKPGTSSDMLQKVKSKTKSESRKKLKAVSSSKRSRAASISKTTARRFSGKSAYGAVHDEPICVDKPVDHDTSAPDSGSEDVKNTPGSGGGSKDDGEKSDVKLKIQDPQRIDSNSKQAMPETVNPSDNGSPKAGTVSCSFNSDQTMPVGATLSKDEISEGGDESHGSDGPKREQKGEASSSLSPETD
ncbi:ANDROGEN INDUCED INHIBITOR OF PROLIFERATION AS3 / PDS5-RELATED [Salix viminalis]|uniref:ANDROGEN INDUCED INHIBITOR OF PROLIFERATION AS3 / PDS5-RELATED n=1 Tax=Salix viminalis TaxID=40686 RepID=A0A9Q0QAK2_SALVM|nr:ANDROGEN INDUCED INHIBITOR OF PROLIFERATION AS3 / PDS5-RELATED [Salix viminalis]